VLGRGCAGGGGCGGGGVGGGGAGGGGGGGGVGLKPPPTNSPHPLGTPLVLNKVHIYIFVLFMLCLVSDIQIRNSTYKCSVVQ